MGQRFDAIDWVYAFVTIKKVCLQVEASDYLKIVFNLSIEFGQVQETI